MNWRDNSMHRLHSILHIGWRAALAACLLFLGSPSVEAKTKKAKKSTPSPVPEAAEAAADKGIDVPIPINHAAKGVRIPIYTPDGKLQMMFESEVAFRVDAQQLRLEQLNIETFDADGKSEMFIDMPKSTFDLKTRMLASTDPVTIRRSDFEVTGGNMTFDTQTRQGKFTGPVRMLIFKNNSEAEKPQEGAPRKKNEPIL